MSVLLYGTSYSPEGSFERRIHDAFVPWAIRRIPHMLRAGVRDFGHCVVYVVASSAEPSARILAVVVFHNYHPAFRFCEVSMACASPMWARPEHIKTMLSYVFDTAGCGRLQAVTPKRGAMAKHVRRFLEKSLGFRYEGVHRLALGSDDAVSFGMLREDASRWLGPPKILEAEAA